MDFIRELAAAYRGYVNAFRFIDQQRFWKIFVIPGICSLIIASFVIWFAWKTSDTLTQYAIIKFKVGGDEFYFNSFLEFIVVTFVRGIILFIYIKIYRYLILILLSPEFSYITSLVMSLSTEERQRFRIKSYFNDIWRSVKTAFKNFVLEILLTVLILLLAIILTWTLPLIPFIIFIIEAYFFGFAMADYRNEFFNIPARESKKIIKSHKGAIIGNGIIFNISLLIPIFGVLFAPTLAVIAAGLTMNEVEEQKDIYVHSVHQSV